MPDVFELADDFRRQLIAREREATRLMFQAYAEAVAALRAEAERYAARLQEAIMAGEEISPSWAFRSGNMQAFTAAYERELANLARTALPLIEDLQAYAARLGVDQMALGMMSQELEDRLRRAGIDLTTALESSWSRPSIDIYTDLVGQLQDGKPLATLLEKAAGESAAAMRREILRSTVLGKGPRELARRIQGHLGGNLTRALRIARTEMLRASRTATQASYEANKHLVGGWVWHSALDNRTCIACASKHGSEHPVTETLQSHPNCRCSMVPISKSWKQLAKELEIPELATLRETRPKVEPGKEWFDRLSAKEQRRLVHPEALEYYRQGLVKFEQLVKIRTSKVWGKAPGRRPLQEVRKLAGVA